MKKYLLTILIITSILHAYASHIVGGEVFYKYLGPGTASNSSSYLVSVRLFTECGQLCGTNGVACPPGSVVVSIFANISPFARITDITLPNTGQPQINLSTYPSCVDITPTVCYQVNTYSVIVELANNAVGYRLAYQSCCRAAAENVVSNISPPTASGNPGATYEATMPGANLLSSGFNSTAVVNLKDTALICFKSPFTLEFSAIDPDGDLLSYQFISAYNGGSHQNSGTPLEADNPLYNVISYMPGYSGSSPLGPTVTINSTTGIISGTAPAIPGVYEVNVLVKEWRNGNIIAEHRKDFLVKVFPCNLTLPQLEPAYVNCDDFTLTFSNLGSTANIQTYTWYFGDGATSSLPSPTHTYATAGDYQLKLVINQGLPCTDSATSIVKVYPGFFPAFAPIPAQCKNTPVQFNDATPPPTYGVINYWRWDFGDQTTLADTSHLTNPVYTYSAAGTYLGEFIVGSSKGCRDTLNPIITIVDKPNFIITKDTLICTVDTLQLHSNVTQGFITWSPGYMINDIHSFNPLISPDVTTTYTAFYQDPFGCSDTKSVKVNVVNEVTLLKANDTTLCRRDSAVLRLNTDALYFQWTPANLMLDSTVRNPVIFPIAPLTTFYVKASISNKCFKLDTVDVKTVPYPVPLIVGPAEICFGKDAQLNASGGSSYLWTPARYLSSTTIPNPIAIKPKVTITYTVNVSDTLGCPKPVSKDFTLNVIKIIADAGPSDTSVVLGQSLELHATGSLNYLWTPSTYLNNPNIASPVSLPQNNITYTVRVSNNTGCFATDTINVKVFFLPPDLYVPSAFTPGGNDMNDLFRPIALGIKSLESFRVYNRWGVLLYKTNVIGEGWNGKYKNAAQETATYVWQANATDYKGKKIFRKGSVILIR